MPTPLASDSFNRANQNPINTNWKVRGIGGYVLGQVLGNQYVGQNASDCDMVYDGGISWPNDQFSQATLRTFNAGKGFPVLLLRASAVNSDGYVVLLDGGSGGGIGIVTGLNIFKGVAGPVATAFVTPQAGDIFKAQIISNVLTVYQNGVLILTYTDLASSFASGKPGIAASPIFGVAGDIAWDDWSGGPAVNPCIVTGTLQTLTSGKIAQGRVIFQLTNIGTGNPIGVSGTSIIPSLTYTVMTAQDGTIFTELWGNDNITPANTVYAVTFRDYQGNEIGPILYSITGSSVNLNTLAAVSTTVPPVIAPAGANPDWINVKNFGAVGSGKTSFGLTVTAGSPIITGPAGTFSATDVGVTIMISGVGVAGVDFWSTIASFQSTTQVTLAAAPTISGSATLLGAPIAIWGMVDDAAAIQAAINSISPLSLNYNGKVIYIPAGVYMLSTPLNLVVPSSATLGEGVPVSFMGDGIFSTTFVASQGNVSGCLTCTNGLGLVNVSNFAVVGHTRPGATLPISGAEIALWLQDSVVENIFVQQTTFKHGIHVRMTNGTINNCSDLLGITYAELDGATCSNCTAVGFLTGCNSAEAFSNTGSESGTMVECLAADQGLLNMAQTSSFFFNQRSSNEQRMFFTRCIGAGGLGGITSAFNVNNCDLISCVGESGNPATEFVLGPLVNLTGCWYDEGTPTAVPNQSIQGMSLVGASAEQALQYQSSELITLNTGATTTDSAANLLPANSIITAVVARITTTITTAANWSLGDATTATRFASANATLVAGTTSVGLNHMQGGVTTNAAGPVQTAAAKLRITLNANPGAGAIRVTVFYTTFTPPTS